MEQKHSGLGIASFVMSLLAGGLTVLLLATAAIMEASNPGGMDEHSPGAIIVGFSVIALLLLDLLALCVGLGSLFQKDRKKTFGVIGIVFALTTLLGTIFIMTVGLMME